MSLGAMAAWRENQPGGAETKRKGRSPEDRMRGLYERHRGNLRRKQIERYGSLLNSANERRGQIARELREIEESLVELLGQMQQGLVKPDDVRRVVAEHVGATDRLNEALAAIERDRDDASAMVDQDPADYEEALLRRFPTLVNGLPLITEGWLLGEDEQDPLGGAR